MACLRWHATSFGTALTTLEGGRREMGLSVRMALVRAALEPSRIVLGLPVHGIQQGCSSEERRYYTQER